MATEHSPYRTNGLSHFLGWLSLLVVLLGAAFQVYGQLQALMAREDEADTDRHQLMERMDRLESLILERLATH